MAKKFNFLDNYACFQNHTFAKSALIETALSGDSLYRHSTSSLHFYESACCQFKIGQWNFTQR